MEPVLDVLLLHLLSFVLKAVDFIFDLLFGRTVTKGSKKERAGAGAWPFAEDSEPSRLVTVLRQATYVGEFPGNGINAKQVSKFRHFNAFSKHDFFKNLIFRVDKKVNKRSE